MPLDPIFECCFAPLIGRPCWQVKSSYGSFVTLEFGEPHLEIREPKTAAKDATAAVRGILARRNITVRGDWHLWVYCCNWTILNGDQIVGASVNNDSFVAATQLLDGQALTSVAMESPATSRFKFDLGGSLITSPYDGVYEQWMLYQPDGFVLTLRGDGKYSNSTPNTRPDQDSWTPAWSP